MATQPERCPTCGHVAGRTSTYLNTAEAMAYLSDEGTPHAFTQRMRRHGVPQLRDGRRVLYLRRDLDDYVQGRLHRRAHGSRIAA